MTKPIVVSLGELLWDMLPSGKRQTVHNATTNHNNQER